MRLLNASGCLDALTAPDVARSLDALPANARAYLRRIPDLLRELGLGALPQDHGPRLVGHGLERPRDGHPTA